MTREEKIKLAIEKGFTYDEVSGKIYGVKGKEIKSSKSGYIKISMTHNKVKIGLQGHHFAYYIKYNKIVINQIDHIDRDRTNNKIDNLREVTNQQNSFNTKCKGYSYRKHMNKYQVRIGIDNKIKCLGSFNTEEEARQAYLDAKQKYHLI